MDDTWMSYLTPTGTRKPHKRLFIYDPRQWETAEYHAKMGNTFHSNSVWDGPEWGLKGPPRKHRDMLGVYPPPTPTNEHRSIWYMRCL